MDWGQLARVQDQIAKTEDLKRQKREIKHKILYKNELEKMIQDKYKQLRTMEEQDKKQTEYNFLTLVTGQITQNVNSRESPYKNRIENLLKESAQYNFSLEKQKKTRLKRQLQQEKSVLRENYKKTQTEISQQKQKMFEEKYKKKRELALCYEAQINSQDSKKYLQKLQNQKFQQLAHELELKKSKQRDQNINKIKFGYLQNPQSFQRVKHLYNQREEQKLNFLKKIENSVQKSESINQDNSKDLKHLQTIETGRFNKNNFLEKQFRMRQLHNKELQAQKLNVIQIRNQLTEEQERVKVKKSLERKNLKTQLEYQINTERQHRMKQKRMSEVQSKLNKPFFQNQISMFPGLSKDHKDLKKQLIIDSFLAGMRPTPNSQRAIK